jgi:integrase
VGELFKQQIVRYVDAEGKRVKAGTPGARKVEEESRKWYGEYRDADGHLQRVPLAVDKKAARQELARLEKEAELTRRGLADPAREEQARRPLAEHLEDFGRHLAAKGAGKKHAGEVKTRVNKILDGCRFTTLADIAPGPVVEFLGGLLKKTPELPPLDPSRDTYSLKELAALIGVKPGSVGPLVRRHRLPARGRGRARRFPRETALALRARAAEPVGPRTVNAYLAALKSFTRWLAGQRPPRLPSDPLAGLTGWNEAEDVRHARRALSPAELVELLRAAEASPKTFRGLTGRDRHFLYLCAMGTGFRASELANLLPSSFALDAEPPVVVCRAGYAKNGKTATQPLPAEIALALRGYLDGRPAGLPVWGGTWTNDGQGSTLLRIDLDAAGIPYAVEGPDGLLYADFHALRHSYIALLDRAGLTLKQAMQLARHSDPKLTMAVYGRATLNDLGAALDRLPELVTAPPQAAALRLTGTDNGSGESGLVTGRVTGASGGKGREPSQPVASVLSGEGEADGAEPRKMLGSDVSGHVVSGNVGRGEEEGLEGTYLPGKQTGCPYITGATSSTMRGRGLPHQGSRQK